VEAARGGIVVPPEDAAALAGAIERMADRRDEAAELGRCGRVHVERDYDRDNLAARMLAVLNDAAAVSRPVESAS
jgi:glycosyltransferase involved in cell wall biosynthesis